MADNIYIDSSNISVFPSGFRTEQVTSKLTTEENVTSLLVSSIKENSFYIEDDICYFSICGYVFKINKTVVDSVCKDQNIVYAYIKLRSIENVGTVLANIENSTQTNLDANSKFYGLAFTTTDPSSGISEHQYMLIWKDNEYVEYTAYDWKNRTIWGQKLEEGNIDGNLENVDHIIPSENNKFDIGTTDKQFNNIYTNNINTKGLNIEGNIVTNITKTYSIGTTDKQFKDINVSNVNTSSINVSGSINPVNTNSYDIGSSDKEFKDIYTHNLHSSLIETSACKSDNILPINSNSNIGSSDNKYTNIYTSTLNATDTLTTNLDATEKIVVKSLNVADIIYDTKYGSGSSIGTFTTGKFNNIYTNNITPLDSSLVTNLGSESSSFTNAYLRNVWSHDTSTSTLKVTNRVASKLVPDVDQAYNLGSETNAWKNLYLSKNIYFQGTDCSIETSPNLDNANDILIKNSSSYLGLQDDKLNASAHGLDLRFSGNKIQCGSNTASKPTTINFDNEGLRVFNGGQIDLTNITPDSSGVSTSKITIGGYETKGGENLILSYYNNGDIPFAVTRSGVIYYKNQTLDTYIKANLGNLYAGNIAVKNTSDSTTSPTFKNATLSETLTTKNIISTNSISCSYLTSSGQITASTFNATSDARLKENLRPLENNPSILDLPLYKFDFKEGKKDNIGCLAQDLQQICPEIVHEDDKGYLSIEETKLVYLLLQEIKKLREEVDNLKSR